MHTNSPQRAFLWVVWLNVYAPSAVYLVDIFDDGSDLTSSRELKLSAIYGHLAKGQRLTVNVQPAQLLEGGSNCRLFAQAVATELCFGSGGPTAIPSTKQGCETSRRTA